jgi:tetratricopeptide (TPR) repeat protein/O-antigen ligase
MNIVITFLLALTLLLAPIYAAQPDSPNPIALASSEWASFLCAGTFLAALLALTAARRGSGPFGVRLTSAEKAFLALLGLAFLSIPLRLLVQHGTGYFGVMLHGWSILAADFALFALARRVAANRVCLYALIFAAVAGSAIVADLGVQEHVSHLRAGDPNARTFGTSTPDFLAGYFVLLLPVTLALFLQMPSARRLTPLLRGLASLVLGVILLFQLITLLTTSSRFGLISLVAALLVFALSLAWAVRQGLRLERTTCVLLGVITVGLLLGGAAFAKPVISRLHNLHDNSAAFRLWTWRGSLHMAMSNPILGTGIGTWTDLYPKYALTGFTRLAHQSYLQLADDCGIPALLVLLTVLGFLAISLLRGLRRKPDTDTPDFLPADNRLLLCGLTAALVGGVVQNLIDSDWYVFFLGTTFWTLAGLAAGTSSPKEAETYPRLPTPVLIAVGSVTGALFLLTGTQGIGSGYAVTALAQKASDPGGAAESYGLARAWDPLNGQYPSDQGFQIDYGHLGDVLSAETALQTAVALEPNSVNFRRLGTILQAAGKNSEAVAAYQNGLRADPNSLDILLRLARLTPSPMALTYYRRISDLELSPVGTARALGESVEPTFAYGDTALGDSSARTAPDQATEYYRRAAALLETYITQGGSLNEQREVMAGGQPDPETDTDLRRLYEHVLASWIQIAPADQQSLLRSRQKEFDAKFDAVIREASKPGIL